MVSLWGLNNQDESGSNNTDWVLSKLFKKNTIFIKFSEAMSMPGSLADVPAFSQHSCGESLPPTLPDGQQSSPALPVLPTHLPHKKVLYMTLGATSSLQS